MNIIQTIANELNVNHTQVDAAVKLLNEGATVPFIARYRKEATGGLTDNDLRQLSERLLYLSELNERRSAIIESICEQKKLTPSLEKAIHAAATKTHLEDLYLPYKPKRRTKAQIAKEAGLEPLADTLLNDPTQDPEREALRYQSDTVTDSKVALDGARQILMERFAEDANLIQVLRDKLSKEGHIYSKLADDKEQQGEKFKDYFEFDEKVNKIPSHRTLALFRGRKESILQLSIRFPEDSQQQDCLKKIAKQFNILDKKRAADAWLLHTVDLTWKMKLRQKLELEVMNELKIRADQQAIDVFRNNLKNLLMAAPAGNQVVLGLDPGFRTGVKAVVIDGTGKLLQFETIFPHPPQKKWNIALDRLNQLCEQHTVTLISIGNGTASRETDQLAAELIQKRSDSYLKKIVVSEAGASVYSASELAAKEFPELDVSYRGAVSIARRLQDPLAELVKIDPKAIGVGQYQHDVNQVKLGRSLGAVVEDCVNTVGADINTASAALLTSISGLNTNIANNIVSYREQQGRFTNRAQIQKVPRLGQKAFEQAAGFLRIMDGNNPLDASSVHPESYPLVNKILSDVTLTIQQVMGNLKLLDSLNPEKYVSDQFGLPTIKDILNELKKPARDPRPEFKTAVFYNNVNKITDLKVGLELEGVVSNVANFGAFVDIGVHQDGLVHVSELANHYVEDIHKVIKVGDIISVKVLEVDVKRKRISLSMKSDHQKKPAIKKSRPKSNNQAPESQLGQALKQALQKKR